MKLKIKIHAITLVIVNYNIVLAKPCFQNDVLMAMQEIKTHLVKSEVSQCIQQEMIEPISNPVVKTQLFLKDCELDTDCLANFRSKMQAKYPELNIKKTDSLTYLWAQNIKYSGYFRRSQIQLTELLTATKSAARYEQYLKITADEKTFNQSHKKAMLCMLSAGMIGFGKLKAIKPAQEAVHLGKIVYKYKVDTSKVDKILVKNKLPKLVLEKFVKWKSDIEEKGLSEVRKSAGYHDEPVKSTKGKVRSVRLNDGYRIFYETVENVTDGKIEIIIKDINMHLY